MKWGCLCTGKGKGAWFPTASISSLALCRTSAAEDALGTLQLYFVEPD